MAVSHRSLLEATAETWYRLTRITRRRKMGELAAAESTENWNLFSIMHSSQARSFLPWE